jgi:hypothetical protein
LQDLFAFAGDILGHAESDREPLGRAEHGVGDSGISAGGIEQNFTGTQQAFAAAFGNDVSGSAVFNGSAWVVPFGLTQEYYAGQIASNLVEAKERRVSDTLDQAVAKSFS